MYLPASLPRVGNPHAHLILIDMDRDTNGSKKNRDGIITYEASLSNPWLANLEVR